ncbi:MULTISPECIES: DUF4973 domain-containing protein [Sphingobacterium]|uniref:DUF4973 domain-containing protein n=1 Tax=Sphingobacterium TaxID=28453 RepID=UPI000E997851|nr:MULTISPECIES: DUF4973 domain-containing protein [Sphingobacterium]HAE67068.1 hypothetical protein [Sphingobacterium sp.]HBI88866.1 hypothetical protein [Sphingobacterium sp.]
MKNLFISILIGFSIVGLNSCNKEYNDELYSNMISLKAPVDGTGLYPIYLRYNPNGIIKYDLPVLLSGSLDSDKDIDVKIGVDMDTLAIFNYQKFQYRKDLYYKQLTEQFYELPQQSVRIAKGTHTANFPITFKFDNLDLVEQWVLPITIQDDAAYKQNYRKGWRKALLYIKPFNNYSGLYSATAMNIYYDKETKDQMVVSNRTNWVVDENSVFFYAGITDERDINRSKYKVIVDFGEATEDGFGTKKGLLTVKAVNNDIGFSVIGQPTYDIRDTPDKTQPYVLHRYITMKMEYKYSDITSVPGKVLNYRATGTMTMERKLNTLMPDEDQAIQW